MVIATGGQPQHEGRKILAERRRGGIVLGTARPVAVEIKAPLGVAIADVAAAVLANVTAHLQAMIPFDFHDVTEDAENIEGRVAVLIPPDSIKTNAPPGRASVSVEREPGDNQVR